MAKGEMWTKPFDTWRRRALEIKAKGMSPLLSSLEYNSRCISVLAYLSQLFEVTPDHIKSLPALELAAIHSIWHVPPSSFNLASAFDGSNFGLPAVKSIAASALAAKLRFALVTWPQWEDEYNLLKETFADEIPLIELRQAETDRSFCPSHWRSPPIVETLHRAVHKCSGPLKEKHAELRGRLRLASSNDKRKIKVQRELYGVIVQQMYPSSLLNLMRRRLCKHMPDLAILIDQEVDWHSVGVHLQACSPHVASCAIKSYLGSWCTSRRMHEEQLLPCTFCRQPNADEWSHYVKCSNLWQQIQIAITTNGRFLDGPYMQAGSADVLARLGLSPCSKNGFIVLAVAFNLYHAIKLGDRNSLASGAVHLGDDQWNAFLQKHLRVILVAKFAT